MRMLSKRWGFGLTRTLLFSAGVLTSSCFSSQSLKACYEFLEQGMTKEEVVLLVDHKTGLRPKWTASFFAVWDDGWNRLEASFYDGRLAAKGLIKSERPTPLRRASDTVIKALHGMPERDRWQK
jgi:hypothetical protein